MRPNLLVTGFRLKAVLQTYFEFIEVKREENATPQHTRTTFDKVSRNICSKNVILDSAFIPESPVKLISVLVLRCKSNPDWPVK